MKSRLIFFLTLTLTYIKSFYLFSSEGNNQSIPPNAILVAEVSSQEDILKAAFISIQTGRPIMFLPVKQECVNPNTYDERTGMTALQKECSQRNANLDKVKHMVEEHEADLNLTTKEPYEHPGLKASEIARDHDNHEIADYLENYKKNDQKQDS